MRFIAEPPELPLSQRASGSLRLRYEDVSQDGRLLPFGMPAALGEVFWRGAAGPLHRQLRGSGVVAILTRLCCATLDGPVAVHNPLTVHARYELAHCRGADGGVARLLLRVWLQLRAPRARTRDPQPDGAGEVIEAGRLFAEHVFTRPFAARAERRVTSLPPGPLPSLPPQRRPWTVPAAMLAPGHGEEALSALPSEQPLMPFGLGHTDSNQHVNSLVYPRLFYDAALRELTPHQPAGELAVRYLELAFRKPFFAGECAVPQLLAYRAGERLTVRGYLGAPGLEPAEREHAHVFGRLTFIRRPSPA